MIDPTDTAALPPRREATRGGSHGTPADADEAMIRLEGVGKSFGPTTVLDGVDLTVRAGETTVIIGASGTGKSVLLKTMIGLIRPDRGRVFFHEQDVTGLSERKLHPIRARMGFLFQGAALFDSMTVEENVCFPMAEHNMPRDKQRRRCAEVLSMVGLDGLQARYPVELSGGQKKRIALARAIALRPEVVFYDEPTTGLDPIRADLISELILRLQTALDNAAVVVTHDMTSARKIGHRILMLHEGRFILDTTPAGLENIQDRTVARFIRGQASEEELDRIRRGSRQAATEANDGSRA